MVGKHRDTGGKHRAYKGRHRRGALGRFWDEFIGKPPTPPSTRKYRHIT